MDVCRWTVAAPGRLERSWVAAGPLSDGHVVVAVEAVALNRRDLALVDGAGPLGRAARGTVPCSDAAGVVVAQGANSPWEIGTRVVTRFLPDWIDGPPPARDPVPGFGGPRAGVLATHVVAPAGFFTRAPAPLSAIEASTLPCAGLTAWNAVGRDAVEGKWVAVHGSGGVATFALQIAAARGARVVVVTRDPGRTARLRELGAATVVAATAEWPSRVLDLTMGRGADVVVDMGVRGALAQWLQLAAPGGSIALVGRIDGTEVQLDLDPCLRRAVSLRGVSAGSLADEYAFHAFVAGNGLRPVVDAVVPFEEAPRAFERLRRSSGPGKIVVQVA